MLNSFCNLSAPPALVESTTFCAFASAASVAEVHSVTHLAAKALHARSCAWSSSCFRCWERLARAAAARFLSASTFARSCESKARISCNFVFTSTNGPVLTWANSTVFWSTFCEASVQRWCTPLTKASMLSTRPGADEAAAAWTASIEIHTFSPLRANANCALPSPGAKSSRPSPASILPTVLPPSWALHASDASAQTYRSHKNRCKSANFTWPFGAMSFATSAARSSDKRMPPSPVVSASLPSQATKASEEHGLPPAMPLKSSPDELPLARMWPRRAQATACACANASSWDLSSASRG
mmetsp:Transcript_126899/g.367285  ORF Transcript_126899/g.367285 Transcript_126899/m.367285 type:complete len:299 (+) Transcript_126899:563-1459(+)